MEGLKDFIEIEDGSLIVKDRTNLLNALDSILYEAVFEENEEKKKTHLEAIKEISKAEGIIPASIQGLYEEMGKNYLGFTVPAINIRGLTYDVARVVFRKALEHNVGAFILNHARKRCCINVWS